MRTTEKKVRAFVRKQLIKEMYGTRGNQPPPKDSSWSAFAQALDIGVLDLDGMAYDLGFSDFRDMDISIGPRDLAKRDPQKFVAAAQESSMKAQDMSNDQILGAADMPGMH